MKKILFPALNRVHLARQKLLLEELKKHFEVDIQEYKPPYIDMVSNSVNIAGYFSMLVKNNDYDLALIRADRYEMLPIAMLCAYKGIPIAHLEGGDLSGGVDNKVRFAISALADIHFATNEDSYGRLLLMRTDPKWTFNFGSLDVEIAKNIKLKEYNEEFVLMCHHSLKGENPALIEKIIREEFKGKVIVIKSNSDYGITYGTEEFPPEEYLNLIAKARCLVGNSSSFIKEASAYGTPVVLIGNRQKNRLLTPNITKVPFDESMIRVAVQAQLKSYYEPSDIYYKKNTSRKIAEKIKEFLE